MRFAPLLAVALLVAHPLAAAAESAPRPWPERYGGDDPAGRPRGLPAKALEVLGRAMEAAGAPPCRPSARLDTAARAHARELLAAGGRPRRVDPRRVRDGLLRTGAVDPTVLPFAVSFVGAADLEGPLGRLAARQASRPLTHCGAGDAMSGDRSVLVVLGVRRHLRLDPFPCKVVPGDRQRLSGLLAEGYRSPSVVVTTPGGDIVERLALRRAGRFEAAVDFPATGRYTVEVMAVGSRGPEAVALFPVFVGAEPSELLGPADEAGPADEPASAEQVLLDLLNAERRRADLPPLEADEEIGRLAAAHSADMMRSGYFGHVSPTEGDVAHRLAAAGFVVLRAAENLARSSSAARAHRTLMESPSHRANVLDPELTHVGIGVARADGELYVTEIYVAF